MRGGQFSLDLRESSRLIYVEFQDASWRDERLKPIDPMLPSKNYQAYLSFLVPRRIDQMDVGERLEPEGILIILYDGETGEFAGYILRTIISGLSGFTAENFSFWINVTAPEPPSLLYDEGYAELMRNSKDSWILDINAWFTIYQLAPGGETVKHYVKLNFKNNH
ncbi:hypothetical protein DRO58_04370 [Candidatus Bathyarchaeota archaeon]|nr:MAG: hypothetical protein DRO58_04370 [Candidatus Bathyarchaeota archaeon]